MSVVKAERYAAYKDSGVEWLGEVPEHWEIKHLKSLAEIKGGKDSSNVEIEEGGYPVYGSGGIFGRASAYLHNKPSVLLGRKGTVDKPLFVTEPFWSVDTMFYTDIKKKVIPKFFYYKCLIIQFGLYQYGSAVPSMASNVLSRILFAVPSLTEQASIVEYLDTKIGQIDRQIGLLDQKATLYGKLKQSLINETVTRGLDKSVPMKDSGVEWVGAVPKHWKIKRVLDVAHVYNGNSLNDTLKEIFSDNSIPCLPYIGTKDIDISLYKANFRNGVYIPNSEAIYKRTPANSTLLCIEGGSAGKKMTFVREQVCFVNKLLCFAANPRTYSLYLHYFVRSSQFSSKFKTCLTGLKDNYWGVTGQQIRRFSVPIPPFLEQQEIADYLDEKTTQIDRITIAINTQITHLKDLRKALINDVVTGKIKVVSEEGQVV